MIVLLVGATIAIVVTPFVIFRFFQRFYLVAAIDATLVVIGIVASVHAWRTGKTERPALVLAVVLGLTIVALSVVIGLDGAMWVFPVVLFVFYLVPPVFGLVAMLCVTAAFVLQEFMMPGSIFSTPYQMISFLAALVTAAVFSYVFALRASIQRDQLMQLSIRDALTNLYNRRHLEEELNVALSERDRYGMTYGLLIFDVDRFKEINDQAGHAAGDRVLVELADLIRQSIRGSDRAFRYGGDEFVILCPRVTVESLAQIADHLVSSVPRHISDVSGVSVTISVGGATLAEDDTKESWNKRADHRLYEAKARGRNNAVVIENGT